MSIFEIFDKRAKFLKKSTDPLAERGLQLYCRNEGKNYLYFCGLTDSDKNDWDSFKIWIRNRILGGRVSDDELLQLYLNWCDGHVPLSESNIETIRGFWNTGGPSAFNYKDDVSGQFWIFAAYAESHG